MTGQRDRSSPPSSPSPRGSEASLGTDPQDPQYEWEAALFELQAYLHTFGLELPNGPHEPLSYYNGTGSSGDTGIDLSTSSNYNTGYVPTTSIYNDPKVWFNNLFKFANCPSQPPNPKSEHPRVRIPYKTFFVQLKAIEPQGPCAYFNMMDDVQWTLQSFAMRWLDGEFNEGRLARFTSITWIKVNMIVAARVMKNVGVGVYSFVRATVSHIDMITMKIDLYDLDDGCTYETTVKDLFRLPSEAMAVPLGMCRARIDKTQLFQGSGLIYKACMNHGIKIDTIFQASRLHPVAHLGTLCEQLACTDEGGFYSDLTLQIWTKERVNLGDIIVSKIAEMTRIPEPEDILFQEVIVTHIEPTGDIYYTLKAERDNHIQPIQDILEQLDTFIRNGLPRARAQFSNCFDVDVIKERLLTDNFDEIFVVPYRKDNLYYRARVIGKIGEDKGLVRFVDYGNTQIVELADIILLDYFDKALSLIPPQSRHARIAGVQRFTPAVDCILETCESNLKIRKASTWNEDDAVEGYPIISGQPLISLRVLLEEFGRRDQCANHAPAA